MKSIIGDGDWGLGPIPNPQSPFFMIQYISILNSYKQKLKSIK